MSALVVVVLVGPQASGKSTIAASLAGALRDDGHAVALVTLDDIAAMALPTLPSWEAAHRIYAMVVGAWAGSGIECVVAEGSGSSGEVAEMLDQPPSVTVPITVAVSTSFETAFARAQLDPTRGISRDRDFLRSVYDRWSEESSRIRVDVVVDTDRSSVEDAVTAVRETIARALERRAG